MAVLVLDKGMEMVREVAPSSATTNFASGCFAVVDAPLTLGWRISHV